MDLYVQAIPVGTYRVQSPGFPKIVCVGQNLVKVVTTFEEKVELK